MSLLLYGVNLFIIYLFYKLISGYLRSRIMLPDLCSRNVFITGCDSGFGRALALELDRKGIPVIAGCLTKLGCSELKQACSSRLHSVLLDVREERMIEEAVTFVKSIIGQNGKLWGLVNNAGILHTIAPTEWQTKEDYDKTFSVNLYGTILVTTAFLPLLRQSKGRIVNISSICALVPVPGTVSYNISKAGIEAFTDTLRREMYNIGVTAHIIQPSGFATKVFPVDAEQRLQAAFDRLSPEAKKFYGQKSVNLEKTILGSLGSKISSLQGGDKKATKASISFDHDLSKVTDVMTHALFAKYPKHRYRVGSGSLLLFWPMSHMSEQITDRCFCLPHPCDF